MSQNCFPIHLLVVPGLLSLLATSPRASACDGIVSEIKTVYFGVEVPLPDPDHPVAVTAGHTDLDTPYVNCAWDVEVSPDSGNIPSEAALIYAGTQARFNLASIPAGFEFIGAQPNQTFWILPQNQVSGVVFLGLSTESMTAGDRSRICEWNPGDPRGGATVDAKWIRIELVGMRAPDGGHFSLWQTAGAGVATQYMSTLEGGITDADAIHVVAGSHSHANWGFTKAGLYELDFRISSYVAPLKGDVECDCDVNFDDIPAFVEALLTPETFESNHPDCNIVNADINDDGLHDGRDLQEFVDLLTTF